MDLKEALKTLPKGPGIYKMKNASDIIIYVGKAKNLKNRVCQYFRKNAHNSPKVNEMVEQIQSFEYVTVDTELDAFLLECKTIKELQPRYNRLMKNNKGYQYIRVSVSDAYPKIIIVPQPKKDKELYFGPFTSKSSIENALQFFKDHYPIRKCNGAMKKNVSGCLNYHLENCLGPCTGNDVQVEYRNQIQNIIQLIKGKDNSSIKQLKAKMAAAAENLEFERAVQYREQLKGIRHILGKQRVIKISGYGRNVLAAEKFGENKMKLFFIKGNKLLHSEVMDMSFFKGEIPEEKLKGFITQFFKPVKRDAGYIFSQGEIDEAQIIYSYLRNKNNGIWSVNIPASRIDSYNYKNLCARIDNYFA